MKLRRRPRRPRLPGTSLYLFVALHLLLLAYAIFLDYTPWVRDVMFFFVGASLALDLVNIRSRRDRLRMQRMGTPEFFPDVIGPDHPMWPVFQALRDGKAQAFSGVMGITEDGKTEMIDWHFHHSDDKDDQEAIAEFIQQRVMEHAGHGGWYEDELGLHCSGDNELVTPTPEVLRHGTWTCHVCGAERPDSKISVHKRPLPGRFHRVKGEQNIRYCNDRPDCIDGAKTKSLFKEQ